MHERSHLGHSPREAVASSSTTNLFCRTRARARAMICRWPSEKFPPPLPTLVSNVMRSCSRRSDCKLNKPADRSASFNTASSWSLKGSKFWRIVPDYRVQTEPDGSSTGTGTHEKFWLLRNYGDGTAQGFKIELAGGKSIVQHFTVSRD